MPNSAQTDDIAYQPTQKGYSYSNNSSKNPFKKTNTFVTLATEIILLFLVFFVFLGVLNYFKIISLSGISPTLNNLPKSSSNSTLGQKQQNQLPSNIPGANQFTINGILEGYSENTVDIISGDKTITVEYNLDSKFYLSKTILDPSNTSSSSENIAVIDFPTSVLSKKNIGKNITLDYKNEKNKNILETLTLHK